VQAKPAYRTQLFYYLNLSLGISSYMSQLSWSIVD